MALLKNLIPRVYKNDRTTVIYWLGYELVLSNN